MTNVDVEWTDHDSTQVRAAGLQIIMIMMMGLIRVEQAH